MQPLGGGYYKFQMDNGFMLWSFQGKQLKSQGFENFYQFSWRPRKSLLSEDKKKEISQNLKKYYEEFDRRDKEKARAHYLEETRGKRELRAKFRERLRRLKEGYRAERDKRAAMNDGYYSDDESNFIKEEYTVTTIISTEEFIVDSFQ